MSFIEALLVRIGTALVNGYLQKRGSAVILSGHRLIVRDERGHLVAGVKKSEQGKPPATPL